MRLLFVCSGNICRSPMAAEYAAQRVAQCGLSHIVVDSAGTLGINGAPASKEAVLAMEEKGYDLSEHRSRGLRRADIRASEMVLVMDHRHLDEIEHRFYSPGAKILLLRAFETGPDPVPGAPDLSDPIGTSLNNYRDRLTEIMDSVDNLMIHLKHLE
jgi:protein-tyrosine-phosphatase